MARRTARPPARRSAWRRWGTALAACILVLLVALAAAYWDEVLFVGRFVRAQAIGRRYVRQHASIATDISPHPNVDTTLDIYWAEGLATGPVLVFVHGGSWSRFGKEDFSPLAAVLVPRGYTVVITDYTLYPEATYERMADEVAAAVAWTLEHAHDYGGDPDRIYLAGHSAGAHLAALVVTEERWLARYDHEASELAGLIGISGTYDLALQAAYGRSLWGSEELIAGVAGGWRNYAQASPITYVRRGLPPTLLIHGTEDTTVPHAASRAFCDALHAAGSDCELALYPGAGHTDYLFRSLWGADLRLLRDLERFTGIRTTEDR